MAVTEIKLEREEHALAVGLPVEDDDEEELSVTP
jgi:hypothetical protein